MFFSTATPTLAPVHERSDIECLHDALSVFIPASLITDGRNVTWREQSCSVTSNGTHYVSSIGLSDCGTTVVLENDTVTYYNELIVHTDTDYAYYDSEVIYGNEYDAVIPVECIFPRFSNLSTNYAPVKQNVRFFEKQYGELDVSMQQFDFSDFDTPVSDNGTPRKIPLGEDLYFRVGLTHESTDLRVVTDQCIATATPNAADSHWRPLIADRYDFFEVVYFVAKR